MRRLTAIVAVAAVVWLCSPVLLQQATGHSAPAAAVRIISPPPAVALPLGQGIEVRYQVDATAVVELRVWTERLPRTGQNAAASERLVAREQAPAGHVVSHFWTANEEGLHCFVLTAASAASHGQNETAATVARCLTIAPAGTPVKLDVEENLTSDLSHAAITGNWPASAKASAAQASRAEATQSTRR